MERFLNPMLCASDTAPRVGAGWIIEPKLDGWRAIVHVNNMGGAELYARSGANYSGKVPYIEAEVAANLPPDSAIDGELIGKEWGDVQGVMTRGLDNGVRLNLVVFDITRLNGTDLRGMTWEERRHLLDKIVWDEHVYANAYEDATQEAHDEFMRLGFEGSVTKRRNSRYTNGRSQSWIKCKPQQTAEARVIGFKPGTGSLAGMVGAFEVEMVDSAARTTVKCGTEERHRDATDNPQRWLDTIIEVRHHGIGKTGKPRHPQFHRRRDDQTAAPTLTPRERQIRQALAAEAAERKQSEPEPAPRRMRNYKAMNPDKLERVYRELDGGPGNDAYERCMDGGSGEPLRDLEVVRQLLREKGLMAA